jgi:hypothetical protein
VRQDPLQLRLFEAFREAVHKFTNSKG